MYQTSNSEFSDTNLVVQRPITTTIYLVIKND